MRLSVRSELRATILNWLENGPLSRRALAGRIFAVTGWDGLMVNRALIELLSEGRVKREPFADYPSRSFVYSKRRLSESQRERFKNDFAQKFAFFQIKVLGHESREHLALAGEHYGKYLFTFPEDNRWAQDYELHSQAMVGGHRADFLLEPRRSGGRRFVVEFKNRFDTFSSGSADLWIPLMESAIDGDAHPILAASFLSKGAIAFARKVGINTLHLRRQFVFSKAALGCAPKAVLDRLRNVICPELFEVIAYKRPFKGMLKERVEEDLNKINTPSVNRPTRWSELRSDLKRILSQCRKYGQTKTQTLRAVKVAIDAEDDDQE